MKPLSLCLHTGGKLATLDEVSAIEAPPPDGVWHPISHRALYDQVVLALNGLNMRVEAEQHALAKEGQRYFGLLQIGNCHKNEDYAYVCGIRGSLDKSYAAGLSFGSQVFVCDNLAFTGEITIARKYTTYIERDLPILASRAVGQLSSRWHDMDRRFEAYKAKELDEPSVNDLMIRALDAGAITCQQIPHVLKEWRHPRHPEFEQCGETVWRLFNAVTEVAKDTSVFMLPKRTMSLHALLDAKCGLATQRELISAGTEDAEVAVNA